MNKTICEIVRKNESDYSSGTPTNISKHVEFSLYDTNNKIDAYINSVPVSGAYDSNGKKKPFPNLVIAVRNIWFRATDLDRKNIRIKATKQKQYIQAFFANVILQEWMRKNAFGMWLNEWGRTLATYGSAMTRWDVKDGELIPTITPWNRLIVDNVDVDSDVKIQRMYLTPAELRKEKTFDQEKVENLLTALSSRKEQSGQNKDNKVTFIEVYKVEGEMEDAMLTDNWDKDDKTYSQQLHIVSFTEGKNRGEFDDFTLYRGKQSRDPNYITHLIKEDGRATGIGAVENAFESQRIATDVMMKIMNLIEITSKIFFVTDDETFLGKNAVKNLQGGEFLIKGRGNEVTQLNNQHDFTPLMNLFQKMENLVKEITNTPDAQRGNTPPSGTPYALGALVQQESSSLFEMMIENKAMHLEEIMRKYIIPLAILPKLDNAEEISAIMDEEGIARLDSMYVPNEAIRRYNQDFFDTTMNGDVPSPYQDVQGQYEQQVRGEMAQFGNQRFFSPGEINWKEFFKDFEWECEVEISGETVDKNAVLQSLNTVLLTIAKNPMILNDPNAKLVFNQILEETGRLSPIQLSTAKNQTPMNGIPQPQTIGGSDAGGGLPVT